MVRLGSGVALALLAVAVGTGVQAHALGARRTSSERAPSTQLLAQAQAGKRSALVIGNGAYTENRLDNAVNDAEAVARTLQEIGFSVTLVLNADRRAIDEAVEAFSRRLGPGEIGLFYYSDHGVQVDGENYLVPINAQLSRQSDAQYDAIPLGKVINAVESTRATAKIIILDACRDNPFYRRWRSTARGGTTRGLATPTTSGEGGTLIAFSTAPGKVAADAVGNSSNSPFTAYLLRHLRTPNLEVGQLFRRVRGDVMQATRNQQIPWVSEALIGDVFLNQRPFGDSAVVGASPGRSEQQPGPSLQPKPQTNEPELQPPTAPSQPGRAGNDWQQAVPAGNQRAATFDELRTYIGIATINMCSLAKANVPFQTAVESNLQMIMGVLRHKHGGLVPGALAPLSREGLANGYMWSVVRRVDSTCGKTLPAEWKKEFAPLLAAAPSQLGRAFYDWDQGSPAGNLRAASTDELNTYMGTGAINMCSLAKANVPFQTAVESNLQMIMGVLRLKHGRLVPGYKAPLSDERLANGSLAGLLMGVDGFCGKNLPTDWKKEFDPLLAKVKESIDR